MSTNFRLAEVNENDDKPKIKIQTGTQWSVMNLFAELQVLENGEWVPVPFIEEHLLDRTVKE